MAFWHTKNLKKLNPEISIMSYHEKFTDGWGLCVLHSYQMANMINSVNDNWLKHSAYRVRVQMKTEIEKKFQSNSLVKTTLETPE